MLIKCFFFSLTFPVAIWFCPVLSESSRLKMNTSGWGQREDNVCRNSSDGYWPKGKKADGISLTYGKLLCVTQPDQCPLSLFSPFTSLWGTFNAQTCSCWETERHLKTLTDVWESVLWGSSGLLVSAFDLRDWRMASQGFSCCCIFFFWLQRECKK